MYIVCDIARALLNIEHWFVPGVDNTSALLVHDIHCTCIYMYNVYIQFVVQVSSFYKVYTSL